MAVPEAFLIFVDDILSLYLLASPTAIRLSKSYCRSVSTCFPGRLPWYRTIESSWWNYWISGNPRPPVVASFKIRFLAGTLHMMKMCFITLSLCGNLLFVGDYGSWCSGRPIFAVSSIMLMWNLVKIWFPWQLLRFLRFSIVIPS